MKKHIHVWHLELLNPAMNEAATARDYRLEKLSPHSAEFARYLYVAVGADWFWYMRLPWSRQHWRERLANPNVELWVAFDEANPVGYFELERQGNSVEICLFGLTPAYIGRGWGRTFLEDAIARAARYAIRVWLHTCTLDHPGALSNYQARGFRVFREEDVTDDIPDTIAPWPGA